jgi:enoyl-CoA hydratase/carnithine racemase
VIESTDEGRIRTVTLDRTERRNALDPAGLDALRDAVTVAETPVVYLRSAGEAFCASADLEVVDDLDREAAESTARQGQRTAAAIAETDSVVVADPRDVAAEIADDERAALSVLKERLRAATDRTTREEREATAFGELVAERPSRKG